MNKNETRNNVRSIREIQDKCDCNEKSIMICSKIMSMDLFNVNNIKGKNIALYFQHKGEVDLVALREHFIKNGASVFYPVTYPTRIIMRKYDPEVDETNQCKIGAMGIREPSNQYNTCDIRKSDLLDLHPFGKEDIYQAANEDSNIDEKHQAVNEDSKISEIHQAAKENSILDEIQETTAVTDDFVQMDWIFIPGIAFDLSGNRIGYGKGYYDIYLSNYKNIGAKYTIAPAFEFQIVDTILMEKHDVPVNIIVTEERIIYTDQSNK